MPINSLRSAPDYTVQALSGGATLTDTAWNAIQAAMNHHNGRGYNACTIQGCRENGRTRPAVGVNGLNQNLSLFRAQIAQPIVIHPGIDRFTLIVSVRMRGWEVSAGQALTAMKFSINSGSARYRLLSVNSTDTPSFPNIGTFIVDGKLNPSVMSNRTSKPAFMEVDFDMTNGNSNLIGLQTVTTISSSIWAGLNYLNLALYKGCDEC